METVAVNFHDDTGGTNGGCTTFKLSDSFKLFPHDNSGFWFSAIGIKQNRLYTYSAQELNLCPRRISPHSPGPSVPFYHVTIVPPPKSTWWHHCPSLSIPSPSTGAAFSQVRLQAGDDAGAVAWTEASSTLELYANHAHFIQEVVKLHSAAW